MLQARMLSHLGEGPGTPGGIGYGVERADDGLLCLIGGEHLCEGEESIHAEPRVLDALGHLQEGIGPIGEFSAHGLRPHEISQYSE